MLQIHTAIKEHELIERASNAGIKVDSTSANWINPRASSLPVIFIGFAGIKIEDIPCAIKILSECWF